MNTIHRSMFALATLAAALLAAGCGGEGSSQSGGRAALDGFVYAAPGGTPVLGYTSTPPSGSSAQAGVQVTVIDRATSQTVATTTTGADGRFAFQNLEAAVRTLRVAPAAGNPVDSTVTLVDNVTVRTGTPPVTRQQATTSVQGQIGSLGTAAEMLVMAPQQPLPAGVTVASAISDGSTAGNATHTTAASEWFFWVDPHPARRFTHPVKLFFVDAASGAVSSIDGTSFPLINGRRYYEFHEADFTSPDAVTVPTTRAAQPAEGARSAPSASALLAAHQFATEEASRDHVPGCTGGQTYALIIQGSNATEMTADVANITGLLGLGPVPKSGTGTVSTLAPGLPDPKATLISMINNICAVAQPCDTILVYVTGHTDPNLNLELDSSQSYVGEVEPGVAKPYRSVNYGEWLPLFRASKACHLIFMFETCYGGGYVQQLGHFYDPKLDPRPGRKVLGLACCKAGVESSGFSTSLSGHSVGGAWTNEFLAAAKNDAKTSPANDTLNRFLCQCQTDAAQEMAFDSHDDVKAQEPPACLSILYPGTCGQTAPQISGIQPQTGKAGDHITITGSGFAGTQTIVKFNGVTATVNSGNATSLDVTVPTGASTGKITVATDGGTATSSANFTVSSSGNAPVIQDFAPKSGKPGDHVDLFGMNLGGTGAVVKFNGMTAVVNLGDDLSIDVTVPAGVSTGPISVTTSGGTATTSSNFTVQ